MKNIHGHYVVTLLIVAVGCGADETAKSESVESGVAAATDGGNAGVDGASGASQAGDSGASTGHTDGASTASPGDVSSARGGDGIMRPAAGGFEACTTGLKAKCSFDDKELACSSVMTPSIPLTAGGTWGNSELAGGPYGAYVEWNEGKTFANPMSPLEGTCDFLAAAFGEPASVTKQVLDLRGGDLGLYTIFRPACMKDGEKYPVITWGNGTCAQSGSYASLLANLASHGFVVFAANSRFTDGGNREMSKALDYAKAANEDPASGLYQKLDLERVGAMGHSQGASATFNVAADPRIKALILWNGGGRSGAAAKPFLSVSADRDVGGTTPQTLRSLVEGAAQPAAWLYYHKILETGGNVTGHLQLMQQPERASDVTVAWWKYILNGDAEAKKMFVGSDCGLCAKPEEFEYGQKGLN